MSKCIIYDASAKTETIIEVPDEQLPVSEPQLPVSEPQPPTLEEVVSGLIEQLVIKGVIA